MRDARTFRVGAHVDGVNGYPNCLLSITPESVSIRFDGRFARLFHPRMSGRTVVHRGDEVTVARIRWDLPWRRVALLLFDEDHQVVVFGSRKKAVPIVDALRAGSHPIHEVAFRYLSAGALVALERYRFRVRRPGRRG